MAKLEIKNDEYVLKIIHDLKTPTYAQIKALESFLMTTSSKISQEEKDLIELTLNSCNYMQNMIEIFSMVEMLNYEPLKLNYEKFDMYELIENSIEKFKILLKYHELNIDFTGNETVVYADKMKLRGIIENLIYININQAFKNSKISISLSHHKENAIFEVKSHSPYIEPKILKEIFERNKMYPSYYNKAVIGLGLYLAKEIINAHFGVMILKSEIENINVFGFEIPEN